MLRLNLTSSHSQVKNLDIGLQRVMMMLILIFVLLAQFGVATRQQNAAFFDIGVFNSLAPSNRSTTLSAA